MLDFFASLELLDHYSQELEGRQLQLTNLPIPLPENDGDPILALNLILQHQPLEVLYISTDDPRDYAAGDDDEVYACVDSALNAICCGDMSLIIQPQECESWAWLSQLPAILRNQSPEWHLVGAGIDVAGLSFYVVRRTPAADGSPVLKDITASPLVRLTAIIRLADGSVYTYHHEPSSNPKEDDFDFLVVNNPDGSTDLVHICASELNDFQTCLKVRHYAPK